MGKSRIKRFTLSQVNKPYLKERVITRSSSLGDLASVGPVGMSDQGLHQLSRRLLLTLLRLSSHSFIANFAPVTLILRSISISI